MSGEKMKLTDHDYKMLEEREEQLTKELEKIRSEVIKRASYIIGENLNVQKFHGRIGNRNTTFVDSMRLQFSDPYDFLSQWVKGLIDKVMSVEEKQRRKYNGHVYQNTSAHELLKFVKDSLIRDYIFKFLVRNFYREFIPRTRAKPGEILWQLWFGDNQKLIWGLIIAPAYRDKGWTNDRSEVRRADYSYWTIGHVLKTGLIDPMSKKTVTWSSAEQFIDFYRSVLKRLSNPTYEQGIADRYIEYLQNSPDIDDEPFLIPELRYAGLHKEHKYRLDFAVLNSHVMKSTGFELSPSSTHQSISGIRNKTQAQLNQELAQQWNKEMKKRNEYFASFEIPIVTFTDEDLQDLDQCFATIKIYLSQRSAARIALVDMVSRIENFKIYDS
jgi:hypothetical protein